MRTEPTMIVSSSTGSVQFSSWNGLRTDTRPPVSSQVKPIRRASASKVGVHRSIGQAPIAASEAYQRVQSTPLS
ncbi:Uncharacterised protein (plasmid) [Tsukamurella tyrosinosolvens]|nr:Uncharacterised protein [Tsukamurella tyrosinosolvens]